MTDCQLKKYFIDDLLFLIVINDSNNMYLLVVNEI